MATSNRRIHPVLGLGVVALLGGLSGCGLVRIGGAAAPSHAEAERTNAPVRAAGDAVPSSDRRLPGAVRRLPPRSDRAPRRRAFEDRRGARDRQPVRASPGARRHPEACAHGARGRRDLRARDATAKAYLDAGRGVTYGERNQKPSVDLRPLFDEETERDLFCSPAIDGDEAARAAVKPLFTKERLDEDGAARLGAVDVVHGDFAPAFLEAIQRGKTWAWFPAMPSKR